MPDPFGMRWFGIFTATLVLGAASALILPRGLGELVYMTGVVACGLGEIVASELSTTARRWLLGHWR